MPFVQIAYAAERMAQANDPADAEDLRRTIALSSQSALSLIDGYLLGAALQRQGRLQLEPVSVSSVLHDSMQALTPYAKAMGCELRLQLDGKYEPVMAHRSALQSALTSLGYTFIEAASSHEAGDPPVVNLVVRRRQGGISTGVFSNNSSLSPVLLHKAREMHGLIHQPIPGFDSGNASGVFVADVLFNTIETTMKVAQDRGLKGLAATLVPSRQLQLV